MQDLTGLRLQHDLPSPSSGLYLWVAGYGAIDGSRPVIFLRNSLHLIPQPTKGSGCRCHISMGDTQGRHKRKWWHL